MICILSKISNKVHKLTPTQFIVVGYLLLVWIGAGLLYLPISSIDSQSISFMDAIFTSTSAICVTGLNASNILVKLSMFGQGVILVLIQVGGLGFVTVISFFSVFMNRKIMIKERLYIQEALTQFNVSGLRELIKDILKITVVVEGIGAVLLSIKFIPMFGFEKGLWYSLFHSVSSFCNAGFDLMGSEYYSTLSLGNFYNDIWINVVIGSLIVIGGLGFTVIISLKRDIKKLSLHSKIVIVATILLILIGAILIFVLEHSNENTIGTMTLIEKITCSIFQSITARTAGFSTIDISEMNSSTWIVMLILMIIGASPASTGGGIKVTTFIVYLLAIKAFILNRENIEVGKRSIPMFLVRKAIGLVSFISILIIVSIVTLLIINPQISIGMATVEVISAITTVGFTLGGTEILNLYGKILIMILMLIGRIGSLTVLIAISTNNNQFKFKRKYPEENILIG